MVRWLMVRKGKKDSFGLQLPISYIDIEGFSFLAVEGSFFLQLTSRVSVPKCMLQCVVLQL